MEPKAEKDEDYASDEDEAMDLDDEIEDEEVGPPADGLSEAMRRRGEETRLEG